MRWTLAVGLLVLAAPVLAGGPGCPQGGDWSPPCHTERFYSWYRPDQRRDTMRDEPEYHPRLPHARSVGAGRQRGRPAPVDEEVRKRDLAQWLSPADDPVGYRGLCELHHSGPPCLGDNRPLPEWLPDSPDELSWERPICSLDELDSRRPRR